MTIQDAVNGKRILIWGYGREGKASERYLQQFCNCELVDIFEGKLEDIDEDKYDLILKSPGIVMEEDRPKFSSQTELFLNQYRNQVVGITGTKGKSTTSAMMAHVLKACTNRPVILLGNIGLPCMDYCEEITDDTIIVFEMSCHQLKFTKVSPHISVFLNLFEEHLDYYKTMEAYFTAKSHIASNQLQGDFYYCGENVPEFDTKATKEIITYEDVVDSSLKIYGEHNQLNATFVREIAKKNFGCLDSAIDRALSSFEGLPHRLATVGCYGGIDWYDDSISTIPEAAISAIESLPRIQTILIGGMDRGISYEVLEEYMKKHDDIQYICMYESGKRVFDEIGTDDFATEFGHVDGADGFDFRNYAGDLKHIYYVEDLKQAIELATHITQKGNGCVLSPAAASYGYFKNFEERGDVFASLVKTR